MRLFADRLRALALATLLAACGPSPAATEPTGATTGTLVVVVRQGPDLVPFHPTLARIGQANAQLAEKLGHSIRIELDGALLPQSRDGAEDLLAHLVEDVARDMDALSKTDPKALAFAAETFERLVVRYSPAEAAARETNEPRGGASAPAKLDPGTKTIDVVRKQATWLALDRGEVASVLYRAFEESAVARYASVLPDAVPARQRRDWFEYHRSHGASKKDAHDAYAQVGAVVARRVRGMVMLDGMARRDESPDLAKDVRAWLLSAVSDFASAYHHELAKIESAPPSSTYRQAETAYMDWLRAELPGMSRDERGTLASHLWVFDFRKDTSARDRFAARAFPGIDLMTFSLSAMDAWIAEGHPPRPPSHDVHPLYAATVCPVVVGPKKSELRFDHVGRCEATFYRWAVADPSREDALARAILARNDPFLATSAFYNVRTAQRNEADYLRFLRRFEAVPALWAIGADVLRAEVYRPDPLLLDESRRLWRTVPPARARVLSWFASHAEGSYTPDKEWPDLLSGIPADEATLDGFVSLGAQTFKHLPAAWPALAKTGGRVRAITKGAKQLLDDDVSISGTLASVARLLCDDRAMGELAELRAWAQSELARRPGAGLSEVVSAADPGACKPKTASRP